jgi:hypothetical protein
MRVQTAAVVLADPWSANLAVSSLALACLCRALQPIDTATLEADGFGAELPGLIGRDLLVGVDTDQPSPWIKYNWTRAFALWRAAVTAWRNKGPGSRSLAPIAGINSSDLRTVIERRSSRTFSRVLDMDQLDNTVDAMSRSLVLSPYLTWHLAANGVVGLPDAVYRLKVDDATHSVAPIGPYAATEVSKLGQGQRWITAGSGIVALLGVNWARASSIYGDAASAYLQVLLDLGKVMQGVVLAAYRSGLVASMTPAVDEGLAAALCRTNEKEEEIMYLVRIGAPKGHDNGF